MCHSISIAREVRLDVGVRGFEKRYRKILREVRALSQAQHKNIVRYYQARHHRRLALRLLLFFGTLASSSRAPFCVTPAGQWY